MKLITHNMLTSKIIKNVVNGYPLKIVATKTELKKSDFQPDFIGRLLKRVDYKALYEAAQTVSWLFLFSDLILYMIRCATAKIQAKFFTPIFYYIFWKPFQKENYMSKPKFIWTIFHRVMAIWRFRVRLGRLGTWSEKKFFF